MDHEFWHQRWQSKQIGFHRSDVHPFLRRYIGRLGLGRGDCVFVPLCGKSLDMLWLRRQGFSVIGVEISPIAVQAFVQENELAAEERAAGALSLFESEGIELYCGDFFDLDRAALRGCRAVYDRAALVAFPSGQREAYARHLMHIVPPGARILLVTLEYPQSQMDGPPFSVTPEEVKNLFGASYRIEALESADALDESPHLREKGLTTLHERVLLLTPHTA